MQTRMDKYNTTDLNVKSRTSKNKDLYENVKNSSMDGYDIKSNVAVLDNNGETINVEHVKEILDKRYSENAPKRVSITLPKESELVIEDTIEPTKEYDINAVLEKAKKGKNIDYNKERLKKVRETQYEILNNLDLDFKDIEEEKNEEKEKELINLINTITDLEKEYKTSKVKKDTDYAYELLSDLKDEESTSVLPNEIKTEQYTTEQEEDTKQEETKEEENNIEKTLNKLQIDKKDYDDFKDISSTETSSIIIKIILILVVIALVAGGIYILDNILSLGLF